MQQAKDNLNPAASQQTAALRNGNPPPPVVSMVSNLEIFLRSFFFYYYKLFYSKAGNTNTNKMIALIKDIFTQDDLRINLFAVISVQCLYR